MDYLSSDELLIRHSSQCIGDTYMNIIRYTYVHIYIEIYCFKMKL